MSNPKLEDMDSTIEALQAQIERVKWNVEYHQKKVKEEELQLLALEAAVHHHKTFGHESK